MKVTVVPICDGSYDVLRTWTVSDPCNAMKLSKHLQIIHVRDEKGPQFLECPSNIVESTDSVQVLCYQSTCLMYWLRTTAPE
jgi:hypothetical protein